MSGPSATGPISPMTMVFLSPTASLAIFSVSENRYLGDFFGFLVMFKNSHQHHKLVTNIDVVYGPRIVSEACSSVIFSSVSKLVWLTKNVFEIIASAPAFINF